MPRRRAAALPIFNSDGFSTPALLRRLYLVLKFTSTGTPAGEPPATRSALESFTLPLVSASPPREDTVPSRSTTPPRPAEESRKPVKARFSALIASLASSGVSEVSSWFTGPAVPASLNLPPCGRSAVTVTGNCETMETSEAVISRLS